MSASTLRTSPESMAMIGWKCSMSSPLFSARRSAASTCRRWLRRSASSLEKSRKLFLPISFAWYIAASAFLSSASPSAPSSG